MDIIQGNTHSLQAKDSTGAYVAKNYLLWGTTTNAVETEIFVGGVTNSRIAVGANTTINYSVQVCLLYTSPSPRDGLLSRMPSSA